MYNEEQKLSFIRQYTNSLQTDTMCRELFRFSAPFEESAGKDLCAMNQEELSSVLENMAGFGIRSTSCWSRIIILKEYVTWCIASGVPNATNAIYHVDISGINKIKEYMVSGPAHLQRVLNEAFESESEQSMGNVYRSYFWLAFSGVYEQDILSVTKEDINFDTMLIHYGEQFLPIYRESVAALRNACCLTSFKYNHPLYGQSIWRNRVQGDSILRGVRTEPVIGSIRRKAVELINQAIDNGANIPHIAYYRMIFSGVFYRMYELERAGYPVDFTDAVSYYMSRKEYSFGDDQKAYMRKRRKYIKEYETDYQRWKAAFMI